MMNSQRGLHTVGHNIANKETEGYSRQRVETQTSGAQGQGKMRIGMGATTGMIRRINNPYLERQLGHEGSALAMAEGRQQGLSRLEQIYNEQSVEGFNTSVGVFFNTFRELSTNPESMPRRFEVITAAENLANHFHTIHSQLGEVAGDMNTQLKISATDINAITAEIAQLNEQIQKVELTGAQANDERDRRDLLLKKLGEIVDIQWSEGENSQVTISTAKNALLVVGNRWSRVDAVSTPAREGKMAGDFDLIYYHDEYAEPLILSDRIQGGRLGGLLGVRDGDLLKMRQDMDELAQTITREVNRLHRQGFNAYNQRGVNFFNDLEGTEGAAQGINISQELKGDPARLAVGLDPHRPGDNRVAIEISEIQYNRPLFNEGSMTLDEFYNGLVGKLGIKAQAANRAVENQTHMVDQLNNLRESISGVSLDEEAAQMIETQKHFDAAARLIRTADEVLETVINLRRY